MKISIKKIFILGFVIFLLIQFYQPARNLDYGQVLPIHFTKIYAVPSDVKSILRTSCYDCHSNNTEYPWYSYIQPVRMFLDSHIKEGKENLNFSTFGDYSQHKQGNKLERIVKQIESDEMPLASYTLIHKNAILTQENKKVLINWIESKRDSTARGF
ncbi:MAG: heme-binding domain-containing protein [Methylotenera sp.]|nr:heme-binding domain-containing protein [Flavobacterium sp.]